ncbi:MAG: hypothetical protein KBE04_08990 [Phycisphaerae bacterium]|nr:hypothetical protein [Phycisphaerae bacterium]
MDIRCCATKAGRPTLRPFVSFTLGLWLLGSCVCGLCQRGLAATAAPGQTGAAAATNKPTAAGLAGPVDSNRPCPFTGQITANDVLVRSGPGTHFYQCAKLFQGDKVDVLKEEGGWSQIVPPPGSFAWVALQYIAVDVRDRTAGVVTGQGMAAYAGSELQRPMHSTSTQAVLHRGDRVKLLGQEQEGYLKIACPSGSSLWVSSQYVQAIARPSVADPAAAAVQAVTFGPAAPVDEQKLQEYYQLQERFKAEIAKPLAEQDFTSIKGPLTALAGIQNGGRPAQYARHLLERITSCELAKQASKEVQEQDKQVADALARIDQDRQGRLALRPDLAGFSVMGTLATSNIFVGQQVERYRVTDENGRVLCYAEAVGEAASLDLSPFVGQKVGLVGTIQPYPAIGGALVRFTEIIRLP